MFYWSIPVLNRICQLNHLARNVLFGKFLTINSLFKYIYDYLHHFFFVCLFLFILRKQMGEGHTEWERQNPTQASCGHVWVQRSNSPTVRSWPEPKSRVRHLTDWATQAPLPLFISWVTYSLLLFKKLYISSKESNFWEQSLYFLIILLISVVPIVIYLCVWKPSCYGVILCYLLSA